MTPQEQDSLPLATGCARTGAAVCAESDSVRQDTLQCPDCALAERCRWHGFTATCKGCKARAAARSPECHEARTENRQTQGYRQLLKALGVTHEDVKAAAAADKANS